MKLTFPLLVFFFFFLKAKYKMHGSILEVLQSYAKYKTHGSILEVLQSYYKTLILQILFLKLCI